jgi:CHU_C Type IX secretion signal domain
MPQFVKIMRYCSSILFFLSLGFALIAQSSSPKYAITCLTPCVTIEASKDAPKDIIWSGPKGFSSTLSQVKVCEAGIYKYRFQKNGIWKTDSVIVDNQKVIPNADAGEHRELTCIFNCLELKGNNPGSNYGTTWYGVSGVISNTTDIKICKAGRYIYEIFKGACRSYDTIVVKDNKISPKADAGLDIELNCKLPVSSLQPVFPGNEYAYEWLAPNGKVFSTQLQPKITTAGVYFFKIKRGTCEAKDSVKVSSDFRKPSLTGKHEAKLPCSGKELNLNITCAEKEAIFEWRNKDNVLISKDLKYKFDESSTFFLKSYIPKNGCSDSFSVHIAPRDSVFFDYTTLPACGTIPDGEVILKSVGGGVGPYEISLREGGYEQLKSIKSLSNGTYTLFVKDQNNCVSTSPFTIGAQRRFEWNLATTFDFCSYEQALTIDATVTDATAKNVQYIWSNGSSSEKQIFTSSEKVWVEAFNGCYSERKTIDIKDRFDAIKATQYYSPNVINPLSNNLANRCFRPFLGFPVQQYQLKIYDRWGNNVFQTSDIEACWDATFKGKSINFGTFFWQVTAQIDGCGYPVPWQKSVGITVFSED